VHPSVEGAQTAQIKRRAEEEWVAEAGDQSPALPSVRVSGNDERISYVTTDQDTGRSPLIEALSTAANMLARGRPGKKTGPIVCATRSEYEALLLLVGALRTFVPCCEFHGRNCEPPSELCCEECTETRHSGWTDQQGLKRHGHPHGEVCASPILPCDWCPNAATCAAGAKCLEPR